MIVSLLGGLGFFLLGMVLLTEGLKALAGEALRRILTRFVAGPASGVGWGALFTALVQSSTATTLTTVGFVSAGLLTFTQAVGVIFGANLGTTSTGWIVSQLGFKISLGAISPPLVFIGAGLRLLSRGRGAHIGTAVAGFGLLFVGIDMLQAGMAALATHITPEGLQLVGDGGGWVSRALLVGFGFLMTVIMQSSSASMATTLAAVASGAIGLEQAAALIIGQNVGTTPTAVAAAIGAPAAAKRAALAHVLFNALTAAVAFAALPLMLRGITSIAHGLGADDAPTVLAAFHTCFNVLGVALLLPIVGPFSRMIERIVREPAPRSTRFLTPAVAEVGPVALEAARRAVIQVMAEATREVARVLNGTSPLSTSGDRLQEASSALAEVRRFVHDLARASQGKAEVCRQTTLLHATEHASRLIVALQEISRGDTNGRQFNDPIVAPSVKALKQVAQELSDLCEATSLKIGSGKEYTDWPLSAKVAQTGELSRQLANLRRVERRAALAEAAAGRLDPDAAVARVDTLLWLDRVAYHLWRATYHIGDPAATQAAARGDDDSV